MKILSLDTSMAACSAAVIDTMKTLPVAEAFQAMERGHAEALAQMVVDVMRRSGVEFRELDRIVVTAGPGSFTGVRIGLSFARGLGLALGIPVSGIDSLSAISANVARGAPLLVAADARNGEVYAAAFDSEGRIIGGPLLSTLADAADSLPPNTRVIGTASHAVIAASGRQDLLASSEGDLPVAARFAKLVTPDVPGSMPAPLYLRPPDAKPQTTALRSAGSIVIEDVSPAAAPLLASLHAQSFDTGWDASAFEQLMRMPGAVTRLAIDRGEPVAFILTRTAADEAEIITVATSPSARRRGVARQLFTQMLSELRQQGVHKVFLEVAASNAAAIGLYHAMGFQETGRRKAYYARRHGSEDAIVMSRELAA